MASNVILLLVAYLLGSIPTAVWVGKLFYGKDVREYGSGNAGATNTFRVLGVKAGIPVLLIDILKGFTAVYLVSVFTDFEAGKSALVNFQLATGVAALFGHIFPVFAGFRGGKGIATLLGVMISIEPLGTGLSLIMFILIFLSTRIVSVSSMAAAIVFPLIVNFYIQTEVLSLKLFSIFIAILVLLTHQKNINRLLKGEESRVSFKKRTEQTNEETHS